MPLCIDCAFCQHPPRGTVGGAHLCARPTGTVDCRVIGSTTRRLFVRCEGERRGRRTLLGREKCGPDGTFFQAAPGMPAPPNVGSGGSRA